MSATLRWVWRAGLWGALWGGCVGVYAASPFERLPAPLPVTAAPSAAANDPLYREDAARLVYAAYPGLIHHGLMPAYMYAIAVTQTEVDAQGQVLDVRLVREPAVAKEVGPWGQGLVRQLGHLPAPQGRAGATWVDVWLVDRSGDFQLDTLTEGQER